MIYRLRLYLVYERIEDDGETMNKMESARLQIQPEEGSFSSLFPMDIPSHIVPR